MHTHVVVIGTSAGGIEALRSIVAALPPDFPAAIAVVMHIAPQSPGVLHDIISRAGPLPAVNPRDGERLNPGTIYVAPPDHHLLIEPGRVRITRGPKENRFRPAIDPLFRSAAQVYGPAAIGVILTGTLDDGTAGLWAVKQLGGTAIVQDPGDAMFPGMPLSALQNVNVDHRVPLAQIPALLTRLTAPVAAPEPRMEAMPYMDIEIKIAKEEDPLKAGIGTLGEPSPIACPECHGVLLQLKEAGRIRFRCHTGHAYSAESLLAEISDAVETQLFTAIRAMQEGSILMRQIAAHAAGAHPSSSAAALIERADALERRADQLRAFTASEIPSPTEG